MPPVKKSKSLLITLRGTPQQKVVSFVRCDSRLPCYGITVSSGCVFCLLPYFPDHAKKVPRGAKLQSKSAGKFWFHSGLDVRGARRVSDKSTPEESLTQSVRNGLNSIG